MRPGFFKKFSLYLIWITILAVGLALGGNIEAKEDKSEAKRREAVKAAKEELNNTTWEIELKKTGQGNAKKKVIKDTLRFIDNTIQSDMLVSEGFPPTNFTVRIKREEIVIWETMQTSEDKDIAFWRGEMREDGLMRGVLSRHLNDKAKTVQDYVFVSVGKDTESLAPEPEEPKEAPLEPKEEPQEKAPEPIEAKEEVTEKVAIEPKIEEPAEAKEETKEEPKKKKKKGWWF